MERIVTNVKWKQLYDFKGYFISNNGLAKKGTSLLRIRKAKRTRYLFIVVYKKRTDMKGIKNGEIKHHYDIHRAVWDHFGTGTIKGYDIHHKDFDFTNNHIDNLVYIPEAEHYLLHGKKPKKSLVSG